jgi:PAS domain S-box-containing protein
MFPGIGARIKMLESKLRKAGVLEGILVDALGVGALLIDALTWQILFANRSVCRMLQYAPEELVGTTTSILDLPRPGHSKEPTTDHRRLLNEEIERYSLDRRCIRKDGSIVWAHVTVTAVKDSKGKIRWITCAVEDITESTILKEKLVLAEQLSGLATWNWSVGDNSSETSPRYNALFGVVDEAPSPSIEAFVQRVHPEDRNAVRVNVKRALSGTPYTHEYRIVQADGEIRWLRGMATPVKDGTGKVSNLIGATLDITDLKDGKFLKEVPSNIANAVRYIEQNWNKPLALPAIAKKHKISLRTLHRHFAERGLTPSGFIKQLRLQRAREMLSSPVRRTSVTEVSEKCSFSNLGHFAKDYRKAYGELPSETISRHAE